MYHHKIQYHTKLYKAAKYEAKNECIVNYSTWDMCSFRGAIANNGQRYLNLNVNPT